MKKTIIYIAGYGRSGSTLLERVLASHDRVSGLGELASFLDLLDSEASFCSCGELLHECEFWSEVTSNFGGDVQNNAKLRAIQNRFESLFAFPGHIFSPHKESYSRYIQKLFDNIAHHLPDEVSYVVDSSKTARKSFFRPFALSRIASLNVKVIHLVRDGRGCMWSYLKGSNRRMETGLEPHVPFAALRTAISWPLANVAAHLFQLLHTKRYCRIRYEDFVKDTAGTLAQLGKFLGVSFDQQIEMLNSSGEIPLGHQIAGNRLRSQKKIVLKQDVEWKKRLKLRHKLLFWLLDWPLALWYGYR